MKLNIFSVPQENKYPLIRKFEAVGLSPRPGQNGELQEGIFYFSESKDSIEIPWVKVFSKFFIGDEFQNTIYFGAYVFERDNRIFVLSFGKSHFYIRPFADNDFGIEVAKRIANESDIRQTSSKRYSGNENKKLRSFQKDTKLDIESGETLDYLSGSIVPEYQKSFGKSAKFGSSLHITPDINISGIQPLFDRIEEVLAKPEVFKVPRTIRITSKEKIQACDSELLGAIIKEGGGGTFTAESYETVGVDFIFAGSSETYQLYLHRDKTEMLDVIDIDALTNFIHQNHVSKDKILDIRVKRVKEGEKEWSCSLKEALDFTIENENIILSGGKWLQFNEDYIHQLNEYIDGIEVVPVEECFQDISVPEPTFIDLLDEAENGYLTAHTDFSKIQIKNAPKAKVEAWDLIKGKTAFAVKFGTSQKLGYVCDQAIAVLEILRNKANIKKLDEQIDSYCLWLGYESNNHLSSLSQTDSIILKQKVEAWARKCRNIGITPVLKISRKVKPEDDEIK